MTKHAIAVADEQQALEVDANWLKRRARQVLVAEQVLQAEVSIALVTNARIHEINRQFLQHDFETDVISFVLDCESTLEAAPKKRGKAAVATETPVLPRGAGKILSAELIISTEFAVEMAREYHWEPVDELLLYVVHGLLHVCGYDDLTIKEQRIMRAKETELLAKWKLTPHYTETLTPSRKR